MLTITDRDLLLIEPTVFVDAAAVATHLVSVSDSQISGTSLTSATADFEAAGVDDQHVVLVSAAGKALEIVQRVAAGELQVSLPRAISSDADIAPGDGTGLAIIVPTFARLIAQTRVSVLAALGMDPIHPTDPL